MKNRFTVLAHSARLLIATDFDGTLAAIAERPHMVAPPRSTIDLLRRAIALPQTCVAIVSGRGLSDLRARLGVLEGAWMVGGHGAEIAGPHMELFPDDVTAVLDRIAEPIRAAAPTTLGFWHERKLTSIAVHYRQVDTAVAGAAVRALVALAAEWSGVRVCHGKKVVELLAVDADKGRALRKIRHATGATRVLYLGDDVTDEDAFRALGDDDIAIKVGEPPTDADECVRSIEEAHAILLDVIGQREAWLRDTAPVALHNHSVLSDQRTLAVIGPDSNIRWLCLPRADSGAVFASLVDGPAAGEWFVRPVDGAPPTSQRYLGDTFTLETAWPTFRVTDYLDGSAGRTFQRAGRSDLVRVIEGTGTVRIVFSPRLDFGRVRTRLIPVDGGLIVEGVADPLVLHSPGTKWNLIDYENGHTAEATFTLNGTPVVHELRAGTRSLGESRVREAERRGMTDRTWSAWAGSLRLPGVATDLCRRSALMLRALTYGPTGAILAAGTTSLPENPGGVRNWDYRFCWPRDAAVAASALVRLGNTGIAMKYLDWLLGILDRCAGPERLHPIYTVSGRELGAEADLSHLAGYRKSAPVRIGNAAAQQVQLDVFGPIVGLIHDLAEAGAAMSPDHWRLVEAMATAVERTWHEPDHGIWEIRAERRHHVHSKVMCWLALDRAVKVAEQFIGVARESWVTLRDRIRQDVLDRGFDARLNSFVAAYDWPQADASSLSVGLSGMLDATEPRFVGTVDLVKRELLEGGAVYRYRYEDGLAGPEGAFTLCTGWLVESLARMGRVLEARELFDQLCRCAGPTGVMPEQWCPSEGTSLGNLPQAYSHAALINAAVVLSQIEEKAG